jgi:hypothetical protein
MESLPGQRDSPRVKTADTRAAQDATIEQRWGNARGDQPSGKGRKAINRSRESTVCRFIRWKDAKRVPAWAAPAVCGANRLQP